MHGFANGKLLRWKYDATLGDFHYFIFIVVHIFWFYFTGKCGDETLCFYVPSGTRPAVPYFEVRS